MRVSILSFALVLMTACTAETSAPDEGGGERATTPAPCGERAANPDDPERPCEALKNPAESSQLDQGVTHHALNGYLR